MALLFGVREDKTTVDPRPAADPPGTSATAAPPTQKGLTSCRIVIRLEDLD